MASLYLTLTFDEKAAIRRVMDQYLDGKFDMRHLGKADYHIVNITQDNRAVDYDLYFDQKKAKQIFHDHLYSVDTIISIMLDRSLYGTIGKLRDNKHERLDSDIITCIDDCNRIESRWNKLYVNMFGQLSKIVYNLRIHSITRRSVIGVITCYPVNFAYVRNNDQFRSNYDKVVSRLKRDYQNQATILKESMVLIGGAAKMQFETLLNRQIVNLTEDQLFSLTKDELLKLAPSKDNISESMMMLTSALMRQVDTLKLKYYYDKDDKVNDPDGTLHEYYISYYDLQSLNESNLLRYNHANVDIYNQLLDNKYEEVGGRDKLTTDLIRSHWAIVYDAMDSISYGYDQPIIYKNLCDAFGKDQVDQVWKKYYKFGINDGL
nr:MAG TPA: hypothetical protein [Caudoviricetes sp.]